MNDAMFSSKTDQWETPQSFFDVLDQRYHFTLDVCALPENAKCSRFFTPQTNGLAQTWAGVCWMNPPYGRQIGLWVKKAYEESAHATIVCLLPARTDTKWFHAYVLPHCEVQFIKGRLKFGKATSPAPFPSMLAIFMNRGVSA